ncbi:hypothetical protein RND81_13G141100 [Saponaria officinalis]|uniref:protein-serine/threonine phosphatase n=1 Tax=Saponaria officinalis TaxID=3572 RepID=A0AAW1H0H7_SAPOF
MMEKFEEFLNNFRDHDLDVLIFFKKLNLVLDLDHTLLHAIKTSLLTLEDKQLINPNKLHGILNGALLVKFRPGVEAFLNEVSTMFNLSIFTMANQAYAKAVATLLEGHGNGFHFREVLSREDCVTWRKKTLELMMSHERVTLIVDDTEDVWRDGKKPSYCETNLIKIAPYWFFPTKGVEDEGAMDEELARVLRTLRSVHGAFYGGGDDLNEDGDEVDYSNRDVREVLKSIREEEPKGDDDGSRIEINRKRSHGDCFEQSLNVCEPAKRLKTDTVVNLPCIASC